MAHSLTDNQRRIYAAHNRQIGGNGMQRRCFCTICRYVRAKMQGNRLSPLNVARPLMRCCAAKKTIERCPRHVRQRARVSDSTTGRDSISIVDAGNSDANNNNNNNSKDSTKCNRGEVQTCAALHKSTNSLAPTIQTLDKRLAQYGLEREPTRGDGNCFFHALTSLFARYRNVKMPHDYHATLRQQVCDFVEQNYARFQETIDCEYGSLKQFLTHMRRQGAYADGNMANIVCVLFDINLHIHTVQGVFEAYPDEPGAKECRPVMHMVFSGAHWESTRPIVVAAN